MSECSVDVEQLPGQLIGNLAACRTGFESDELHRESMHTWPGRLFHALRSQESQAVRFGGTSTECSNSVPPTPLISASSSPLSSCSFPFRFTDEACESADPSSLFAGTISTYNSSRSAPIASNESANAFFEAVLQQLHASGILEDSVAGRTQQHIAIANPQLTEEEIAAFPRVCFDRVEPHSCVVCLESYTHGEILTALHCNHFFHADCLLEWLQRSRNCPMCRSPQYCELFNLPKPDVA
jgi:hypothetical protein